MPWVAPQRANHFVDRYTLKPNRKLVSIKIIIQFMQPPKLSGAQPNNVQANKKHTLLSDKYNILCIGACIESRKWRGIILLQTIWNKRLTHHFHYIFLHIIVVHRQNNVSMYAYAEGTVWMRCHPYKCEHDSTVILKIFLCMDGFKKFLTCSVSVND